MLFLESARRQAAPTRVSGNDGPHTYVYQTPPIGRSTAATQDPIAECNHVPDALHGTTHACRIVLMIRTRQHLDNVVPFFDLLNVEERTKMPEVQKLSAKRCGDGVSQDP